MDKEYYLAIDIGASSGRHVIGWTEDGHLVTETVHRFTDFLEERDGHLVWNLDKILKGVLDGIRTAFERRPSLSSVSVDTWGVDYVLMSGDETVPPCYSYRDPRTRDVVGVVHDRIPFERLYAATGIQYQPFNTIYQLYCDKISGRLNGCTDFLMLPEYITYFLTGVKAHEYTDDTTTGLVNALTCDFDDDIVSALGLPKRLFEKPRQPGTKVGRLRPEIRETVGGDCDVVLCASHDTASAVEGIQIDGCEPYLSSGTWSLLGLKVDEALTDDRSRAANFTNEGGVGYYRYQKNIMGMWPVNSIRDEMCPGLSFEEVVASARKSRFEGVVDINDDVFLAPESMRDAFLSRLEKKPSTAGDYFKCVYVSLAQGYRNALDELKRNTGKTFRKLYIAGGGAKNTYLNDLTEKACGVEVVAYPTEITAEGNLRVQMRSRKNG